MTEPKISRGAQLLAEVLQETGKTQGQLAREVGVDSGLVNRWVHGSRTPDRTRAVAVERILGIPVASWDEPSEPESGPHAIEGSEQEASGTEA